MTKERLEEGIRLFHLEETAGMWPYIPEYKRCTIYRNEATYYSENTAEYGGICKGGEPLRQKEF